MKRGCLMVCLLSMSCDCWWSVLWILIFDCVSAVLEPNSCCQSQRTYSQQRPHHSGLSKQTTAIMVWKPDYDENRSVNCGYMWFLRSYFFMRVSVCSVYQGGGKRTAGKEKERLQSPGWFWRQNEQGGYCFFFTWISGSAFWILFALTHFSQRWKKELEKNREKVLGGAEKKEKDKEKEKKEVMVNVEIWDLINKIQVQSGFVLNLMDFI